MTSIKTGYFARLKDYKRMGYSPVAICLYPPKWYDGPVYKKLAPSDGLLKLWKSGGVSREEHQELFRKEALEGFDANEVIEELADMAGSQTLVLLCYEKPSDYCHRQEVAKWLHDETSLNVGELDISPKGLFVK